VRRNQPRGQSAHAARCAVISTFALIGCAASQGTLRALLAFIWVVLLIAGLVLEWRARRRLREAQAATATKGSARDRPPGPGAGASGRTLARRGR
jgi:hypothetical protein